MESILESTYNDAVTAKSQQAFVTDTTIASKIMSVCECESNKAPIRYLLTALLAKTFDSGIDTRHRSLTSSLFIACRSIHLTSHKQILNNL